MFNCGDFLSQLFFYDSKMYSIMLKGLNIYLQMFPEN